MACNPLLICSESPIPFGSSWRAAHYTPAVCAFDFRILAPPLIADAKSNGALVPLALTMSWSRRCGTLHRAQALHQAVERLANLNASARWVGSVGNKKGSLFNGGE